VKISMKKKPGVDSKPHRERGSPETEPDEGRYLYCIAEGNIPLNFGKLGLQGEEVYTIPYKDLCAVVHTCPSKPYQSNDQASVQAWVLAHQKVVDKAWDVFGTVIPMGFDTIVQGDATADPEKNINNWFRDDYDALKTKIEKVRDHAEYGIQVFWDSRIISQKIVGESTEIKKLQEEIEFKPKGIAYMYRQKLENLLKKEMEKRADQYFQTFYEKIKPYASELHIEKTKKTSNKHLWMLMNLSCLLPKNCIEELGDELEQIDVLEGFSVRFTGPWPPYSFV